MNIIAEIEKDYLRTDHPDFGPGDTVIVNVKIK
ncbi:MAG: 50S ribosomal protein L19, partial [Deltaproteobacteria bacterium]|nr:50S ribosomal protein L19 [Deltaproteobacteria bacterium]